MPEQSSATPLHRSDIDSIPGSDIFGTDDSLIHVEKLKEICPLSGSKKFPLSFKQILEFSRGMEDPYLICDYRKGSYFVREYSRNGKKFDAIEEPSDENVLNLKMVQVVPGNTEEVGIKIELFQSLLMKKFGVIENMTIFSGPPRLAILHH
jgi:hypothetical protein